MADQKVWQIKPWRINENSPYNVVVCSFVWQLFLSPWSFWHVGSHVIVVYNDLKFTDIAIFVLLCYIHSAYFMYKLVIVMGLWLSCLA